MSAPEITYLEGGRLSSTLTGRRRLKIARCTGGKASHREGPVWGSTWGFELGGSDLLLLDRLSRATEPSRRPSLHRQAVPQRGGS